MNSTPKYIGLLFIGALLVGALILAANFFKLNGEQLITLLVPILGGSGVFSYLVADWRSNAEAKRRVDESERTQKIRLEAAKKEARLEAESVLEEYGRLYIDELRATQEQGKRDRILLHQRVDSLTGEVTRLTEAQKERDATIESLQAQITELNRQIAELQASNISLSQTKEELARKVAALTAERDSLLHQLAECLAQAGNNPT